MACKYIIYSENNQKEYSYKDLIKLFQDGGYTDFKDILFSRGSKQDSVLSDILGKKKEYYATASTNRYDGEPNYTEGKTLTTQTFIDSGKFVFKGGIHPMLEQDNSDFIEKSTKAYIEEAKRNGQELSEEQARRIAETQLKQWQLINEDAKSIHGLLNSFNFQTGERYDFIKHLEGTRFENQASAIYDQLVGEHGLFHLMRGRHKLSNDAKTRIVQAVNLVAKLTHYGEDIIGHIDNLVIGTDGSLHIYNYKLTSTPVSEWKAVKEEKYRYQMALLKRILQYNGFDTSRMTMHIVPIRVEYSDDMSEIKSATVYSSNSIDMPVGEAFNKYDTMAKYHIKSNMKIEPIKSKIISTINTNLNFIFKERNINLKGIQKTAEEWIKFNYTSKWENRIRKVDAPDHAYELFFDDEFSNPVKIVNPAKPLDNPELKQAVMEHLAEINTNNSEFLGKIIADIQASKRLGYSILERGKSRNMQIAGAFIGKSLEKYINSYREVNGVKEYEWDLISNDTLLDANILLFKNRSDQIDIVCLSNYNLRALAKFNDQLNIMGSYIKDASSSTRGLINYHSNYANIEAVRTMTILNEVIPQLTQDNFILGEMRVISPQNGGMMELYSMESLNKNLFQEVLRVVKSNQPEFNMTNNFSKAKYVDPIDLLVSDYYRIMQTSSLNAAEKQEIADLGFQNLESLSTREQKKVELKAIIEKIFEIDPTIASMKPGAILQSAKSDGNKERRALANLYILCQDAYCYYSGIKVANEYKIGKGYEYGMIQTKVPNQTYQGVVSAFIQAVDDIAFKVKSEYNHIYNFTIDFYNRSGFGNLRASLVGDQAKAFENLYERDSSNKLLMRFRNPYSRDNFVPMTEAEKQYLKKVLFEFAKIRSKIYGFKFDFKSYDAPGLLEFIDKNKGWYFNPPLERASSATMRTRSVKDRFDNWVQDAKLLLRNPKESFNRAVQGIGTEQEADLMEKTFDTLNLRNPFIMGDGFTGGESSRSELLNSHQDGYFETNVENLLAHYLEKYIQTSEFNKTLIGVKGTLLQLEMLGEAVGEENRAGIAQTTKMIQDYIKQNMFNVSIMEPESQRLMAWLEPFRGLVSKAYIAGNITSMFRDTFEGVWQNSMRVLNKYQTDIDSKSLAAAYREVTKASFTSVRNITIIDELCKAYRLSNLDVARISEGLTTSRSGILNVENWMYATLRSPDFLNRMVLFVAKCMKDGCWEAFDLKDNKLVYDWRKDKRYSIYADKSKEGTEEYQRQKIAYYNAIRQYNANHPDNTIEYTDDLPEAYSNEQIQQMRQVSNSIYGAYDKSMRAKYEHTALGLTFAMFSTWMNGAIANYFTKPGQYADSIIDQEQDVDGSGNLLFMDENGIEVTQIQNGDTIQYIYTETGEAVQDPSSLVPIMKNVPRVVQGVWYTLKDSLKALSEGGIAQFKKDIASNPMQLANLRKAISDLLAIALFMALFKLAIAPLYTDYKKSMKDESVVQNAIVEVLYKSSSNSYDGFMGPIAPIQYLGSSTNPPAYALSTKVTGDLFKFAFGDKTFAQLMSGNIAPVKTFKDTIEAELKK